MDIYWMETEQPKSKAAHDMLERILRKNYGIEAPKLSYGPQGKPYLPDGPEFSISHTHGAVAVAIGNAPMGLDLERIRQFHELVPKRIMSPGEYSWFCRRGEMKHDFFALWTLKESYYKYLGTGLQGFPNNTEFRFDGKYWHLEGETLYFQQWEEKNLLMTLCSHEQEAVILHRL